MFNDAQPSAPRNDLADTPRCRALLAVGRRALGADVLLLLTCAADGTPSVHADGQEEEAGPLPGGWPECLTPEGGVTVTRSDTEPERWWSGLALGGTAAWGWLLASGTGDRAATDLGEVMQQLRHLAPVHDPTRVGPFLDPEVIERQSREEAVSHTLQRIIDAIPTPIFFKDAEFRYRGCNRAFSMAILGREPASVLGRTVDEVAPPRMAQRYDDADRTLFSHGGTQRYETEVRFHDGRVRDIDFHKAVIYDRAGRRIGIVGAMRDITEHRRAARALRRSEFRFRRFLDQSADAYFMHDLDGGLLDVNTAACRQLGYDQPTLLGMTMHELHGVEVPDKLRPIWQRLTTDPDAGQQMTETRLKRSDGSTYPVEMRLGYVPDPEGPVILVLATDVTERRRQEAAMRKRESMFRNVFEASEDAILILDGEQFVDCNEATLRILGADSRDGLLPMTPWAVSPPRQPDGRESREKALEMIRLAHERNFHRFEWLCRRVDGSTFPVEATMTTIDFEGRQALYTVCSDITERKAREREIERLANYDPLTDLPNRRLLQRRATRAIEAARRHGHQTAVIYLDLDRFKDVNDTQGHDVGDALLQQVAMRLGEQLRSEDVLARLGGDEFAVLMPRITPGELEGVARRLLEAFRESFALPVTTIRMQASIGAVICPRDGVTLGELLKHADIAMYRAKTDGCGYRLFQPVQGEAVRERVRIERDLERALSEGAIELAYQPRVSAADGSVTSVEALSRWTPNAGRAVAPGHFVPVAESSGLIHRLGRHALLLACRQVRAWHESGTAMRIAINISAKELQREHFSRDFLATLEAEGVPGSWMEVEITESNLMANAEGNVRTLGELKDAGVRIAVDDFGTGYSSLSYLKRLPVDALKIDQSFVRDMTVDPMDAGIVRTIIDLADSLGLTTIAEGVETQEQERALIALGCRGLQGYRYCRPCTAASLRSVLDTQFSLPRA